MQQRAKQGSGSESESGGGVASRRRQRRASSVAAPSADVEYFSFASDKFGYRAFAHSNSCVQNALAHMRSEDHRVKHAAAVLCERQGASHLFDGELPRLPFGLKRLDPLMIRSEEQCKMAGVRPTPPRLLPRYRQPAPGASRPQAQAAASGGGGGGGGGGDGSGDGGGGAGTCL